MCMKQKKKSNTHICVNIQTHILTHIQENNKKNNIFPVMWVKEEEPFWASLLSNLTPSFSSEASLWLAKKASNPSCCCCVTKNIKSIKKHLLKTVCVDLSCRSLCFWFNYCPFCMNVGHWEVSSKSS